MYEPLSDREEHIATAIVQAAYAVQKTLGPGLLENVYETCLCHEISKQGFPTRQQAIVPLIYDGLSFDDAFRLDVLVDDLVVCEVKSVLEMHPVFEAQLLTYLRLSNRRLGFLLNFNVPRIKDGIERLIR